MGGQPQAPEESSRSAGRLLLTEYQVTVVPGFNNTPPTTEFTKPRAMAKARGTSRIAFSTHGGQDYKTPEGLGSAITSPHSTDPAAGPLSLLQALNKLKTNMSFNTVFICQEVLK